MLYLQGRAHGLIPQQGVKPKVYDPSFRMVSQSLVLSLSPLEMTMSAFIQGCFLSSAEYNMLNSYSKGLSVAFQAQG